MYERCQVRMGSVSEEEEGGVDTLVITNIHIMILEGHLDGLLVIVPPQQVDTTSFIQTL